jgi:hypothetical protein
MNDQWHTADPAIEAATNSLAAWCEATPGVRLVAGPPLADAEISALPARIAAENNHRLSVPFEPEAFVIPDDYRSFLRAHDGLRVEFDTGVEGPWRWQTWEPVNVFSAAEVAAGRSFEDAGIGLDDEEIYTSFLVAFATAGWEIEASRYCFGVGLGGESRLPIFVENNDYECDLARYVATDEWVNWSTPWATASFAQWWHALVTHVTTCSTPKASRDDSVAEAIYEDLNKGAGRGSLD